MSSSSAQEQENGNNVASTLAAGCDIARASDVSSLMNALMKAVALHGADACALFRLLPSDPDAQVSAAWGQPSEAPPVVGMRVPRAAFKALAGPQRDDLLIIEELSEDPGLDSDMKRVLTALGARSACMAPVRHGDGLLGVILVAYRTKQRLAPGVARIYGLFGELASVALLTIDSRVQLANKLKQVNALYRISESVGEAADEQEALDRASRMLADDIGYIAGWLATSDEEANLLRERSVGGIVVYPGREPVNFPLNDMSIAAVATFHGRARAFDDAQERADAEGWGDTARAGGLRSAAWLPLRAGGAAIGVLSIGSREERISDDDLSLLGAFCDHLASTILRLRTNQERDKQVLELAEANRRQDELLQTVRDMSTPVIPVDRGILVLPIIGMIDSARSARLMESLLGGIQKDRASVVIIDITGVPTVDTSVAHHLLQSTRAASLLGATCVLVGVSPQVAQTLSALGVELKGLTAKGDLQAGIAYARQLLGGAGR